MQALCMQRDSTWCGVGWAKPVLRTWGYSGKYRRVVCKFHCNLMVHGAALGWAKHVQMGLIKASDIHTAAAKDHFTQRVCRPARISAPRPPHCPPLRLLGPMRHLDLP